MDDKKYRFDSENHVHLLNDKPLMGTSTVVGVIAKPLTWWASGLAVEEMGWQKKLDPRKFTSDEVKLNEGQRKLKAAVALREIKALTGDEYLAKLDKAYRAHKDKLDTSADKGTGMHAELEMYVKTCIRTNVGIPVHAASIGTPLGVFSEWAVENVKRFLVSEGHCYSEKLWVGGITDCIAELKDGRLVIIDFKSSKEAFVSQFVQVAGYHTEVMENGILDADGKFILKLEREIDGYVVFPFGAEKVEPQFQFDTASFKQGFRAAAVLHKLINAN
jgi:hypothetical protein